MKQLISTIFLILYTCIGFSQNVTFDISTSYLFTKLTLKGANVIDKRSNQSSDLRQAVSIGLNTKISKNFYFKTEAGTNSFEDVIQMEYTNTFGKFNFFERYSREQWYFAILPEWRPFEKTPVYINGGWSIYQTFGASGLVGKNTKKSRTGIMINLGATPILTENLGCIVNLGYTYVQGMSDHIDSPTISTKQINVKFGFVYIIK